MSRKGMLQIDRIVGNNVILTLDPGASKEYVLVGKGIGFDFKGSKWVDMEDPRIEKRYRLDEEQPAQQFQELVENIDPEVIQISEQIIESVKERMGTPVQPKVYFALPNHIQFAMYRLQNGMEIINPFLHETKMSFSLEYEIAAQAAIMISERFGILVPEDEVGFLALHVHSCAGNVTVGQLVRITGLLNRIVEYIEQQMKARLQRMGSDYIRLITHIRGTLERLLTGRHIHNPLTAEIKTHYPKLFALATQITGLIKEELDVTVSEDEIGYLAVHLHRLLQVQPPIGRE
ncbi:PRD domain-containing protein [Paenibacillus sp. IITD108]